MNNLTDIVHYGIVEERDSDPYRLGRCKVRVIGLHSENTTDLPTEDLPWAYPLMPVISASMSGVGYSPLGLVEGTVVAVIFRDVYKQHPIIIGSLPGIPEEIEASLSQVTVTEPVLDSSGNLVLDQNGDAILTENKDQAKPVVKKPGGMSVSLVGMNWIKNNEGLASLSKDKRVIGNTATPNKTKIYAYLDVDRYAIGYGMNFINGELVSKDKVITKEEADSLFEEIIQETVKDANKNLQVPVTQSMFDAIVDLMYNAGTTGIVKSSFWSTLNNGNYEEAAALIPVTRATVKGKPNDGLTNRRRAERNKFIEEGIPSSDLTRVEPSPYSQEEDPTLIDKTDNPAVLRPVDFSKSSSGTTVAASFSGFKDPKGKYPRAEFINEPDTHRLARHEKIDETIVAKKEAARVRSVPSSTGAKWDQPPIPYNALYPYNHVHVTESGHVDERDDTPGNERIHTYHRSGTYTEIDRNGTLVNRIVGDKYEILERNGHVLIKGSCELTVQGNVNIRVENDANIQVLGNCSTEVTGNMTQSVGGAYKVKASSIHFEADDIDVFGIGQVNMDADFIYLNSGVAVPSGLVEPTEVAKGLPDFPELVVPDRTNEFFGNYETEEEGDNTEFTKRMLEDGVVKQDDVAPQTKEEETVEETKKTANTSVQQKTVSGPYTSSTKIYNEWTLGDVCKGRSGIPNGTNYGLTSDVIVGNLALLTEHVIDPIKKWYPNIIITNTWRSESVNNSLPGSSKTSDHLKGCAVDFDFSGFTKKQKFDAMVDIQKRLPDYNQFLVEYSGSKMWLHVSFKSSSMGGNKRQVRTIDVQNKSNNRDGLVFYGG